MNRILGAIVLVMVPTLSTLAAGPVTGTCGVPVLAAARSCGGQEPPLVKNFEVYQAPDIPEPPARVPFRDAVFGRCLTRLTDRSTDIAQGDSSQGLKNEYSRVQSFNADESLILIRSTEAYWYVYRADTLQPLGAMALQGSVDPRWDASDPSFLYYMDGTRLMIMLVTTGEREVQHDFAPDLPGMPVETVWTRYEGSPSLDGRYWGFMAQDAHSHTLAFLVYDRFTDRVIANRDVRGVPGIDDVDSVTISPLGDYFVAQFGYCPEGTLGTDAQPCGLMVYDPNLQNGRGLVRNIGHSDLALDADGREVMVYQQLDTDHLSFVDLATGASTDLWPIDFTYTPMGFHFSGRGYRLPGWVLVSTHDGDAASHTWMDDELFAMELRAGGRVVRLAHTHSVVDQGGGQDYFAEPQASANRDFTKLLFTTNWGRTGTQQVETYLVELEPGWDGACRLDCAATVPATAQVGTPAAFGASATATGCQGAASYEWSFGDGTAVSHDQNPTHSYAQAGSYAWSVTAAADQRTCTRSGTIQASASGTCLLTCVASGPTQATVGQEAAFTGAASPTGCAGEVTWDWDFGDGSAHATTAGPSHTYASAGTFTWHVTATVEGIHWVHQGSVLVQPAAPPIVIVGLMPLKAPFRLKITGQEFQEGVKVYLAGDTEPWPSVTRKSSTLLVIKGGASLKARFPSGQSVGIRIVNPDGGSGGVSYTR
jgi:hypothetical protein